MRTNILQYLEETVRRCPDKAAFSDGEHTLTFLELYDRACRIGSALSHKGVRGKPVMVLMDKTPEAIAAFFGIIYAGGFYVALDVKTPAQRARMIFDTVGAAHMVCSDNHLKTAEALHFSGEVMTDSALAGEPVDGQALSEVRNGQLDIDPIYVVFTSGSTGVPKGVVACHRSVIDYTEALCEAVPFDADTVFGNQTPLYFDAPLKEIMPTIKYGATTYLIPQRNFLFPVKLCEFLNTHRINTICWVVSALTMISSLGALDKNPPKYLRLVCFGSEVFPRPQYNLWREAMPHVAFFNLYGPTEATGMSCYWRADRSLDPDEPIPVGRPFRNTGILLLRDDGSEAPAGEIGEICIRGTCVTLGYYANPEKTAEAFVQNPLNHAYPERIYRTGDMGKYNAHGELVFLNRRDSQIKHMGHRIELGEIEAVAATLPGVTRVCCVYDEIKKRIVLFYTCAKTEREPMAQLQTMLPRYMLPALCIALDKMPLTPNGKLDRRGLRLRAENT